MILPDWYLSGGLMEFVWLAGPALAVCLILGIAGAAVQTTTQIRESAITFVPKAVGLLLMIALGGGMMVHHLSAFTQHVFQSVPDMVHVRSN